MRKKPSRLWQSLGIAALAVIESWAQEPVAHVFQAEIIAHSGQIADDERNERFASFRSPAIGADFVAFRGASRIGADGRASGIWRTDDGETFDLVAGKGLETPGVEGAVFSSLGDPVLNENDEIAFLGKMRVGPGGVTRADAAGLWAETSEGLSLIARQGDPAPGLEGAATFARFKQIVFPDDAGPAFLAIVKGAGIDSRNNLGLWSADADGVVSLIVRKGDFVQAGGLARQIANLTLFKGAPKTLGHRRNVSTEQRFIFQVKFTDAATAILLAGADSPPQVLLTLGDFVEEAAGGGFIAALGQPCATDEAALSYLGRITPGLGGSPTEGSGAILTESEDRTVDTRDTLAAPGTNGGAFASFSDPIASRSGALAFLGKLIVGVGDTTANNVTGLWSRSEDRESPITLITRQGDLAPGAGSDARFAKFTQVVLPDTGGPIFTATTTGTGISKANNSGLWASASAASGTLELLVRKGDPFEIEDTTKTVASIVIFKADPGVAGQSRHFNESGNVCALLNFSDRTQAIVRFARAEE
jgi:hypothetical protein